MSTTPKMTVVEGGKSDNPAQEPEQVEELTLSVTVITPFGGSSEASTRRHVINYHRVKHLIENTIRVFREEATAVSAGSATRSASAWRGRAISASRRSPSWPSSNVVVALLSDHNVNVIYELGIRNMHRPETLLLLNKEVAQDGSEPIPVYLKESAFNLFVRPRCGHSATRSRARGAQSRLENGPGWNRKLGADHRFGGPGAARHTLERSLQELVDKPPRWLAVHERTGPGPASGRVSARLVDLSSDQRWCGSTGSGARTICPTAARIWTARPMVADANYLFRRIFHIENLDHGPGCTPPTLPSSA